MAAGITQPGGGTTNIFLEDISHADAGGDGLYSFADIATKFPLVFRPRTTTPLSYESDATVQIGDGTGTAITILKDSRCDVHFAAGKTLLTAGNGGAAGFANRTLELGKLATGADGSPIGYDGCRLFFNANPGSATGFQCNTKLYGCYLANLSAVAATSRIFFQPSFLTGYSEIIDTTIFTLAGTQAFGSTTGAINRIRRLLSMGLGATINGRIVQFSSPDADGVVFYFPNGNQKINTSGYVRLGNPRFLGPSVISDVQMPTAGIMLNPIWSRNVNKALSSLNEEWINFGVLVTDDDGTPVSGVPIEVWDPFDKRFVIQTTTGSLGTLNFTALQSIAEAGAAGASATAPFPNALMVNGHNNDGQQHDHYPFIMYVNRGKVVPDFAPHTQIVAFPYEVFLTTEKQWFPLYLHVTLAKSSGAGYEDWRPEYA